MKIPACSLFFEHIWDELTHTRNICIWTFSYEDKDLEMLIAAGSCTWHHWLPATINVVWLNGICKSLTVLLQKCLICLCNCVTLFLWSSLPCPFKGCSIGVIVYMCRTAVLRLLLRCLCYSKLAFELPGLESILSSPLFCRACLNQFCNAQLENPRGLN